MEDNEPFQKYEILFRLGIKIETLLPLRIGSSQEGTSVVEPDLPIIRDSSGIPIIPGSTLKGFFRANSLRLVENLDSPVEKPERIIQRVFGNMHNHASCLQFLDLKMATGTGGVDTRKHISIDPETGSVGRGKLFEAEIVQEGSVFKGIGVVGRNLSPSLLGLLFAVKHLSDDHIARIGGFKSRGYGAVRIDFDSIEIILPAVRPKALDTGVEIKPSVSYENPVWFKISEEKTISLKVGAHEKQYTANVQDEPAYFGSRVILDNPHGFLESMVTSLATQLKRG